MLQPTSQCCRNLIGLLQAAGGFVKKRVIVYRPLNHAACFAIGNDLESFNSSIRTHQFYICCIEKMLARFQQVSETSTVT